MKWFYAIPIVLSLAVVVGWVVFVRPEAQPIEPDYDSLTMQYHEKKAVADLLQSRAKKDGDWDSAIAAYKDALAIRPDNAEALNDLGASYHQKGERAMAPPIEENLREYSADPNETLAYIKQTLATTPSGKFKWEIPSSLVEPLDKWAAENKDTLLYQRYRNAGVHEVIIYNGTTAEAFRQAEIHYWKSVNAKSDYAPAYRNLGALYIARGRFEDAIDIFKRALQLEPQDRELEQYLQQLQR